MEKTPYNDRLVQRNENIWPEVVLSINDVTHLEEEGGFVKRCCYSISLFSKIGDKKGEEKIKNLKTCMGDVIYGR